MSRHLLSSLKLCRFVYSRIAMEGAMPKAFRLKVRVAPLAIALLAGIVGGNGSAQCRTTQASFGNVRGEKVSLYTLKNSRGTEVQISNYGAIIVAIKTPSRSGKMASVVHGFDRLSDYTSEEYLRLKPHYGAILGRFANRIKNNSYVIDGVTFYRTANGKPYDERVWRASISRTREPALVLRLSDPEGTMGFPGNVDVTVTYILTEMDVLRIDYKARTDKKTIINLTNHSYFNLAGQGTVLDHLLTVNSDTITPGDTENVPTGEVRDVSGTVFDFRTPIPIGRRINEPDALLTRVRGYGVNYSLRGPSGKLRPAARLEDPASGRVLEIWTTQTDMQLYTGNYRPPTVALAKGYVERGAVALEPEHAPNSPNVSSFGSPAITPDNPFHEVTEYRFSVSGPRADEGVLP